MFQRTSVHPLHFTMSQCSAVQCSAVFAKCNALYLSSVQRVTLQCSGVAICAQCNTLYISAVQCAMCTVHCTVGTVQWALHSVQCALCSGLRYSAVGVSQCSGCISVQRVRSQCSGVAICAHKFFLLTWHPLSLLMWHDACMMVSPKQKYKFKYKQKYKYKQRHKYKHKYKYKFSPGIHSLSSCGTMHV